jgi:predicted nuclease of predicted toxin-antitoxin system
MKLLFNQNLSFKLCERLGNVFPDSAQVRRLGMTEADDRTIWQFAGSQGFLLVTLDADYAEMAALLGPPPKLIRLRRGNQPTHVIEGLLRNHQEIIAVFAHDAAACLEIY